MYLLLAGGLGVLAVLSIFFATLGTVHFDPLFMLLSFLVLGASTFGVEYLLSIIFDRPLNRESWLITALIMFFILPPASKPDELLFLALAGVLASVSKILFRWRGKHIFNPAAFAASVLALTTLWPTSWWVGNNMLWPFVLIIGVLIVRKIRHTGMVVCFLTVSVLVQSIQFLYTGHLSIDSVQHMLLASPLIFLSTIMLTEPATMPTRKIHQYIFAAGVAVLSSSNISIGSFYIYPEVALLLGNLYAFTVSPKFAITMRLLRVDKVSQNVMSFVFLPKRSFAFKAGQYMEWTLPGVKFDARGNRRMFTIASAPTEEEVIIGVKLYEPSSAYKQHLSTMRPGDVIHASQLTGSFTMPQDTSKKLAFIAGGIGITPFRSMIKTLIDSNELRDVVLIYAVSREDEISYLEIFREARAMGMQVNFVMTNPSENPVQDITYAPLNRVTIEHLVPDIHERQYFVSGPNTMVDGVKRSLKEIGVASGSIKTDHFSGY